MRHRIVLLSRNYHKKNIVSMDDFGLCNESLAMCMQLKCLRREEGGIFLLQAFLDRRLLVLPDITNRFAKG